MAFGDWDEVLNEYQKVYLQSKYAEHAKGMLELIPKIRHHPDFEDVLPGTSHGTFFMEIPPNRTTVRVWCEKSGVFAVYLSHPTSGDSEEAEIETESIISGLQQYLQKIRR